MFTWSFTIHCMYLQFSSVTQSCSTLWNPMDYSMPVFSVHHQLLERTQTHVHWDGDAISSSVIPFSCLQFSPESGSFPVSQFFISGGQSIGASASTSILPMNIQDWFPLRWTGLISLQSKGLSSLLQHHSLKASILRPSAFFMVQLSHSYTALTRRTFFSKVISLLCNMLSRLVTGEGTGNPFQYSCLETPMDR